MRCKSLLAAALVLPFLAAGAQAGSTLVGIWGGHSNDTGGVIPWTPETAHIYRYIAGEECARWNKVAYITSVHPVYGDFIGFVCHWPRHYDPRLARAWSWPF